MEELKNLSPHVTLIIGLVGLVPIVIRFGKVFFVLNLNFAAFANQLVMLVKDDQFDRAIKLCGAAPNAFGVASFKAMLMAAQGGNTSRQSLLGAWGGAIEPSLRALGSLKLASFLGLLLCLVPGAHAIVADLPLAATTIGPTAAGLFMFALLLLNGSGIQSKASAGRDMVISAILAKSGV